MSTSVRALRAETTVAATTSLMISDACVRTASLAAHVKLVSNLLAFPSNGLRETLRVISRTDPVSSAAARRGSAPATGAAPARTFGGKRQVVGGQLAVHYFGINYCNVS